MHDDTQGYTGSVQTLPQARMNGAADTADTRGKRIANRTPWLDLPEPYDNLRVRVWLDYPQEIAELLTAPAEETPEQASARMMEFFKGVILQHDGWEMDDGPWGCGSSRRSRRETPAPHARAGARAGESAKGERPPGV
jgi:hypothetical protein